MPQGQAHTAVPAHNAKPAEPAGFISTAFLSVKPLEVVLVADNHNYAKWLAYYVKDGRLDPAKDSHWVWVPLPRDLKLVRKGSEGNIVFEFDRKDSAATFLKNLGGKGFIKKGREDNVYVGAAGK
jgi:hypothetical protein